MKSVLMSLVMMLSFAAHAGHDGPQAMAFAAPLAEYEVKSGFMLPPGAISNRLYQVMKDGQVIVRASAQGQEDQVTVPLKLSAAKLKTLKNLIAQVQPGDLVDENPDRPGCMDAPSTEMRVYSSSEGSIVLQQNENCKNLTIKDASATDQQLIAMIKDIVARAQKAARQ